MSISKLLIRSKKQLSKVLPGKLSLRISFLFLGIASTVWFLIRVIPKPSRAAYPCMRTAIPIVSAFVLYIISLTSSVMAYRIFKKKLAMNKYIPALGFLIVAIVSIYLSGITNPSGLRASQLVDKATFDANTPVGIAKGIHPGRVVWVWDNDATDENCTNTTGDYWFQNTDQAVVEGILEAGIKNLAGEESASAAWDAVFRHFNSNHGKGDVGYQAGEKIYIKINITNSCCSVTGTEKTSDFERMDATPEVALAILRQLIENAGVAQSDIYLGDAFRIFHDLYWDMCHSVYPNVNYCDGNGANGRHKVTATAEDIMKFSDGVLDYRIPQEYVDAAYFINLPCLKSHDSGGITLAAKNHQGSILQDGAATSGQSAWDMHYSLPDHDDTDGGNYRYRHLVDYIGHEHLGGKTLLNIVDGIWAGKSWEGWVEKWQMEPFNNDYPNSLFLSQDNLAIESVCFDFLLAEYENKDASEQYPYMAGTSDYLFQAADPANWAPGVTYDPEGDGSQLGSLGVYEHWNNPSDKQYSRNLGTGDGIELVAVFGVEPPNSIVGPDSENNVITVRNYPNPATDFVFFEYTLNSPGLVTIEIYSMEGRKISQLQSRNEYTGNHKLSLNVDQFPAGIYVFRLEIKTNAGILSSITSFQVN